MKKNNKKRNKIILLIIILLGTTIGFAALSTTLRMNGLAGLRRSRWSVYWSNPQVIGGSVSETLPVIGEDEGDSANTKVTWSVSFNEPGQFYGFTIDATNAGSIDAIIKSIESTTNPSVLPEYITYSITHADGTTIANDELLKKSDGTTPTRKKYKIMVIYDPTNEQYKDIPNEGITIGFETKPVYEQKPAPQVTPAPTKEKVVLKSQDTKLAGLSDSELVNYYGEDVTGFNTIYPIEWQLFYSDADNVYLITKDYVRNKYLPSELAKGDDTDESPNYHADFGDCILVKRYQYIDSNIIYQDPWKDGSSSNALINNPLTDKYLKWVKENPTNTSENVQATAYMMDTSIWANFAGNVEGAFAMGGPTLEMYALSYNAKHENKLLTYETLNSDNANSHGYKVCVEQVNGSCYYTQVKMSTDNTTDDMWNICSTDKSSVFWIASPAAETFSDASPYLYYAECVNSGKWINDVYIGQKSTDNQCFNTSKFSGFRPLVAIPKSSLK